VASRTQDKAHEFAKAHQIPHAYGSYEQILADPEVDIVYIATPHPQHREWTIRAAQAQKHILCEKPLGLHHNEAVEMLQAVWENNVFFMEAYMYRCHPQIHRMLELINQGAIGEVRTINATFGFSATYDLENRLFNRTLGGGGILDVGGYCTSMVRLIAGASTRAAVEPERLFAVGTIGLESGVDEYAAALLLFPKGIVAHLSCGVRLNQQNQVVIQGTAGSITLPEPWVSNVDGGESKILLHKNGADPETITVSSPPLYSLEADLAAHHIGQGHKEAPWPAMTWADTLGNIRTQDKWRRALDSTGPSFSDPAAKTQPLAFATWEQRFTKCFLAAVDKYRSGHQKAAGLLDDRGIKFLHSIGHNEQEFFDFVEDFAKYGEPTLETALKIASVRRDYFLKEQNGTFSPHRTAMDQLPSKDAEIEGIGWLPRIIPKAQAKLRGEMPAELMYGCGGDRKFFRTYQIDPADFLQHVRQAGDDTAAIVAWVKSQSGA
jgi:predicted dehydrogenase